MNQEQHELFHKLFFILEQLAEPKYERGALEHGGLITDLTEEQLEAAELEEIIDLVHYRLAKILRRRNDQATNN